MKSSRLGRISHGRLNGIGKGDLSEPKLRLNTFRDLRAPLMSWRRCLFVLIVCVIYLMSLLIARTFTSVSLEAAPFRARRMKNRPTSEIDGSKISPVISRKRGNVSGNSRWRNNQWKNRHVLTNITEIDQAHPPDGMKVLPRYWKVSMVWFSLRTFWRNRHYPILFACGKRGKVIMDNAFLDPKEVQGAEVVLFAGGFKNDGLWKELQDHRDPNQIWLFNTDESPLTARTHIPPKHLRHITFNVTFTYRSNADISVPYGYYEKYEKPRNVTVDHHKASPRFAAWISSHCDTIAWNRTGFVWDISRLISVDKYGTCGNLTCGDATKYWENVVHGSTVCKKLLKQYKFLFALENSCCSEYISEKFWNILRHYNAIPIVIGAKKEDYERIAPPNSFIYAADFTSMEDLATYLKEVAGDPQLFNSFFKWKSEGKVEGYHEKQRRIGYTAANCRILEYLQNPNKSQGHYDLHGPAWLGGCVECGAMEIIKHYDKTGYSYVQE